jgi:putative ABC transport system permease protein
MLTNYLKTAVRSILRERQYALIKIIGLSLGLGTSMVLLLYISHQLSYDSMHRDISRMYRVNQSNIWDPNGGVFSSTGPAVAFALRNDFPEIEDILRINTPYALTARYTKPNGDVIAFQESKVLAADSNFFSFFNFKLKEGDPRTALIGKNKVVLSDKAAMRLFGSDPAVGKIIQVGDDRTAVEVTAVTEEQPTNMHFQFDYLLSMYTNPNIKEFEWSWIWTQVVTYVKLAPGADTDLLNEKLKTFANRHAPATFQKLQMDYKEFISEKGPWLLYLQPVKDIHLYSDRIGNRIGVVGDIKYIYILSVIAAFILLIAVINFINLSTARATNRAKEVGVKKTLGMLRRSLIAQFQIEHILLTMVSMLLGLGFMEILRLIIQPYVGIEIPLSVWSAGTFILIIVLFPIIIGFLAGLYPSFYLTAFRPAHVLKGKLATGLRSSKMRNGLVVFQFTISIALMAATLIVFQQLEFFQSRSVGFEKENLLVVNNAEKLVHHLESFRNEISKHDGVVSSSVSMDIRGGFEDIYMREGDMKKLSISGFKVDEHFFETTKIQLVSGRPFDKNRPSDQNAAVVINETTARFFDWTPETALGKKIIYLGDEMGPQEVIGVAKDFHFRSLHQNIMPTMFFNLNSKAFGDIKIVFVRYNTRDINGLIRNLENDWNKLVEATPFSISFYDEEVKMQYQQEQRMASLFSIFTGLSITIAVIGLVGLVSYSAEQRKKEIGIRKVFGASLSRIYVMINIQYVRLLCISLLIATPASWLLMQQWLNTFPYRVEVNPLIFVISGLVELVLALLCVSYLALRAASLNPATVLKDE